MTARPDQDDAPDDLGVFTERAASAGGSAPDGRVARERGADAPAGFDLAVKANVAVAGFRLSAGSRVLERHVSPADSPVVAALRAGGGRIVGTTNMHELAFGITSNNAAFGPVRLPGHPDRSAGGSSGGSAAAVAAGLVDLAVGTDTGGSVSLPAALCGVVGLRPSTGRWPTADSVGLSWTRDTLGVFARSVADARRADALVTHETDAHPAGAIRLGLPKQYLDDLDPRVETALRDALDRLEGAVELIEADLAPVLGLTAPAEMPITLWESRRLLGLAAATALGEAPDEAFERLVAGTLSPDVRAILEAELAAPTSGEVYGRSIRAVIDARRTYHRLLDELGADALLFPSAPAPAPLIGEDDTVEHLGRREPVFGLYTSRLGSGTVLGAPMLTLPAPVPGGALPVGVTLQGRRFHDRRLLDIGEAVESALAAD
ncbi:amidase family protein [Gulosibacter sp. 10]|uniref:amidase family protein n=1 Tax=Gulosibacter sp. 10 TaxID=1255570 RepID=UPI00097E86BF|nr:amidase family protein [Gulosibacter sp. 10]SJM60625.1 Indoleacetamide hydrolase [Gulosibacter sp. 10]